MAEMTDEELLNYLPESTDTRSAREIAHDKRVADWENEWGDWATVDTENMSYVPVAQLASLVKPAIAVAHHPDVGLPEFVRMGWDGVKDIAKHWANNVDEAIYDVGTSFGPQELIALPFDMLWPEGLPIDTIKAGSDRNVTNAGTLFTEPDTLENGDIVNRLKENPIKQGLNWFIDTFSTPQKEKLRRK